MARFCIQVHPHRCPQGDVAELFSQCERLTTDKDWVRRFRAEHGFDEHAYVKLWFETEYPKLLWQGLNARLYSAGALGKLMRTASIAMCEGRHGWDDGLLLYHYDVGVSTDPSLH
jgi:hypothetical protein